MIIELNYGEFSNLYTTGVFKEWIPQTVNDNKLTPLKNLTRELFNSFSNSHYNAFLSLKDNLYYGETE